MVKWARRAVRRALERVDLYILCQPRWRHAFAFYSAFFEHLPALRPYRGPAALGEQPYLDQCYLVTHIVFTLTNWGELRIDLSCCRRVLLRAGTSLCR